MATDPELAVRGAVTDGEMHTLFAAAWGGDSDTSWAPILARSLAWITTRRDGTLVGFVNVATDGGSHAFLLDTTVHPDEQHRGLGTRLVRAATEQARAAGAEWLHVDYEPHLTGFYAGCGFRPTDAGLRRLAPAPTAAPG
ncbi:GNAT family N-acetyltransferase [Actinocatenispora sera]|uniref:GNAT family N-acetyltransferase n=1 Tax=Actinocatenispora sera TaxID=390989 RepID=UPI0033CCEA2F